MARKRPAAKQVGKRLDFEQLERRALLAVTSAVANGVLTVSSDAADAIAITCGGGAVKINGADPDTGAANCGAVVSINVNGGPGDNTIDLSGIVTGSFTKLTRVSVNGGDGADTITGSEFGDELTGGDDDDTLSGGGGIDRLVESGDEDFTLTDTRLTGLGTDVLSGIERANLTGGSGDNVLDASAFTGATTLDGGGGNDTLIGGTANDKLKGGVGTDTVDFRDAPNSVKVNLITGSARGRGKDLLTEIENVVGSDFDDRLAGNASENYLVGGAGIDRIKGHEGNDTLDGGAGNDIMQGGLGHDVLLGGADNDQLIGSFGRDLLIGGSGADRLVGTDGDDMLIAGRTDHDANDAALRAIMDEWTSLRPYTVRVSNIRDGSGSTDRVNGTSFFNADTVDDDGTVDTLTGSLGEDWFFARTSAASDIVTDRSAAESLDAI